MRAPPVSPRASLRFAIQTSLLGRHYHCCRSSLVPLLTVRTDLLSGRWWTPLGLSFSVALLASASPPVLQDLQFSRCRRFALYLWLTASSTGPNPNGTDEGAVGGDRCTVIQGPRVSGDSLPEESAHRQIRVCQCILPGGIR